MKNTIIVGLLILFSFSSFGQNDTTYTYTFDKENVVASAIDGAWEFDKEEIKMTFHKDTTVLKLLPAKYLKFLGDKTIYHAGFVSFDGQSEKHPFILITLHGNPHLVYFRERDNDPYGDAESFNLVIAKGETKSEDKLFIGGDFNNQSFREFTRGK